MTDLKIMEVEHCGFVSKCMSSPQSYERDANQFGAPSIKRTADYATRKLEEARAKDVETHERNAPAIANNQAVRKAIAEIMEAIGIPESYSEVDRRSRSRYPKRIRHDAGYIQDLRRHVPIDDAFDSATRTYGMLKARYDEFAGEAARAAERQQEEAARAAEKRREERKANLELAQIILRYSLPEDIEWDGILAELRKKHQRLDLAIAMVDTRGDWSEGYYRVNEAMCRFKIETNEDKEIANDILSHLRDEDIDGRVFRDTRWNYDKLFSSIEDQQLVADAKLARERSRDA